MRTARINPPPPDANVASPPEAPWSRLIPDEQWMGFQSAVTAFDEADIGFLLHGAMALAAYTGHWRNTKDVDVIVRPEDHERAIAALGAAGFTDYFEREAYDRSWIYRAFQAGGLVDVIWDLPNHRVPIDDAWFTRARPLCLRRCVYRAVPPEELVRVKLYVMQRQRCDWVDVLNVLARAGGQMDWPWLIQRMGPDLPLLHAVLALFNWLCPGRALALPEWGVGAGRVRFADDRDGRLSRDGGAPRAAV